MKKDIYKSLFVTVKPRVQPLKPERQLSSSQEVVLKFDMPDVQKAEIVNLPEPQKVVFPEVQKVEVLNPTPQPEPVKFPDVQKVEVLNPTPQAEKTDVAGIEKLLSKLLAKTITFPKVQQVEVTNQVEKLDIPIGKGNKPGKADPTRYVPVRLTDGDKFYNALQDAYISAAKATKVKPWAAATIDSLSNTAVAVNTTYGEFGGYFIYNPNSSVVYVQVYKSANPTVGTTQHAMVYGIPATSGANIEFERGIDVGSVFSVAATTTANNSTAPVSPLTCTFYYL